MTNFIGEVYLVSSVNIMGYFSPKEGMYSATIIVESG